MKPYTIDADGTVCHEEKVVSEKKWRKLFVSKSMDQESWGYYVNDMEENPFSGGIEFVEIGALKELEEKCKRYEAANNKALEILGGFESNGWEEAVWEAVEALKEGSENE